MKAKKEKIITVVRRDFNARIGREGGGAEGEKKESEDKKRWHSKYLKVKQEGKRLVEFIEGRR